LLIVALLQGYQYSGKKTGKLPGSSSGYQVEEKLALASWKLSTRKFIFQSNKFTALPPRHQDTRVMCKQVFAPVLDEYLLIPSCLRAFVAITNPLLRAFLARIYA
jgi:hypothetical protein